MLPSAVAVQWMPIPPGTARRGIAWQLLRAMVGAPAASITNVCPQCGAPHGPVRIVGADVVASVTYAGGFAIVCTAGKAVAAAVGIDAESVSDPRRSAAAMRGIIHPGRSSSLREWTRVEAVLKADGRGLRVAPATVSLREGEGAWNATVEDSPRVFNGWDVPGPPGTIVSVAMEPVSAGEGLAAAAGPATP
ncbi:chemotaxis protein CheY [Microbacterium deminutum]|uniref:4-phosphopantetheinyl transferase n=1 Tax=Microbacterium deminutum TaxID=344164 RepID=A0ABP5CNR4_9MICO